MKEISALNEQLLRAIGFGVAIYAEKTGEQIFANAAFSQWFGDLPSKGLITDVLQLDSLSDVTTALRESGKYQKEIRFRIKRRTTIVAVDVTQNVIGELDVLILQAQNITRIRELETMIESYSAMMERNTRDIEREKGQVEKLLLNILPKGAYDEYKSVGVVTPSRFAASGVLHLDFVEFQDAMEQMAPAQFVAELNELHSAFDRIAEQFGCERIKTTGDTYVVISGLQDKTANHGRAVFETAVRFLRYLERRNALGEQSWSCRIGLGVGPVLGSIIGVQRYVYDVFGPAVVRARDAKARAHAMSICADPSIEHVPEGIAATVDDLGFAHVTLEGTSET